MIQVQPEELVSSETATQTENGSENYRPMVMNTDKYTSNFPPEIRNNSEILSLFVSLPEEYREKLISI